MTPVLRDVFHDNVIVYRDDSLLFARSEEELLSVLGQGALALPSSHSKAECVKKVRAFRNQHKMVWPSLFVL